MLIVSILCLEKCADGKRSRDRAPPAQCLWRLAERLRAYPTHRFSDKAALLYTAELRLTSSWDPRNWRLLDFLDVDWVQFVPFAELGRVADDWSITELHKDVKWDLGLGLRLIMRKAVFRIEMAGNDDSWSSWVMIGHPF